eukprot:scaffold52866_cov33-Prasinocladus_malaysianus.AAC.1
MRPCDTEDANQGFCSKGACFWYNKWIALASLLASSRIECAGGETAHERSAPLRRIENFTPNATERPRTIMYSLYMAWKA